MLGMILGVYMQVTSGGMRPWKWFRNKNEFLNAKANDVAGDLAIEEAACRYSGTGASRDEQVTEWKNTVHALQQALGQVEGAGGYGIALEYELTRLRSRIDAIVLTKHAVLVLEFKRSNASAGTKRRVLEYASYLSNFHSKSMHYPVVPVLVTGSTPGFDHKQTTKSCLPDSAIEPRSPIICGYNQEALKGLFKWESQQWEDLKELDAQDWMNGQYLPMPHIVEKAIQLFRCQTDEAISDHAAPQPDIDNACEELNKAKEHAGVIDQNGKQVIAT
jgi:hypothetical protein